MTNTTEPDQVITVRSLRHLDALVAEVLMGWVWWLNTDTDKARLLPPMTRPQPNLSGLWLKDMRPDFASDEFDWSSTLPEYTTWPGLEPVIRNREEAGFKWNIDSVPESGYYWASLQSTHPTTSENHHAHVASAPIAFCLAALASAGCRVRLELGEG